MQKHIRILGGLAVVLASALTAQAVEQSSWGQIKAAVNGDSLAAGKAAVPQAKGTVKPFELAVEALQDVNQVTDVTVTTKVILSGFAAPTLSKHIQLKSFDTSGELRWTKNQMNVALTPSGGSSSAGFQYSDMLRLQPIQVREQVQNAQTGNTEVLEAKGVVKLRPDVAVQDITVPPQVRVGQLFNIAVSVAELNGDLGATTNVVLNEGATLRDHTDGVSISPLGAVGVVFTTKFDQAGTYTLTVVAKDVVPGDYDASNNAKSITIVVTENMQAVPFWLYYYSYGYHYDYFYSYWGYEYQYTSIWDYTYRYQYLYEQLQLPTNSISFPVDKVSLQISTDNVPRLAVEATNIPADYNYDDGCTSYAVGSQYISDGVYVYLQHYNSCGGYSYDYAYAQQYAYQNTYFSWWYEYYYGSVYSGSSSYDDRYGTVIPTATNRVDTRFVVEDGGQAYGGNASIESIFYYPYDYNWSDWYGHYNYHYDQASGSAWGNTQP